MVYMKLALSSSVVVMMSALLGGCLMHDHHAPAYGQPTHQHGYVQPTHGQTVYGQPTHGQTVYGQPTHGQTVYVQH